MQSGTTGTCVPLLLLDVHRFIFGMECRGSTLASRLAIYYPDRFIGFAFLGVGYTPPTPFRMDEMMAATKKALGYELFGYMEHVPISALPCRRS